MRKPVTVDRELDEAEWLRAAARNPSFQDLASTEEDIYSLEDGRPFIDTTPLNLKLSKASPPTTWQREEIYDDDGR